MSVSRAMRRKHERDKLKEDRPKGDPADWTAQELAKSTGVKVSSLYEWAEARTREIEDELSEQMAKILWDTENYIALANIIIMLYAMLKTFGDLKTVQKGLNRLVRNISPAMDEVDAMGLKEAYLRLTTFYGLDDLVFEDFDLGKIWDSKSRVDMTVEKVMLKKASEKGDTK